MLKEWIRRQAGGSNNGAIGGFDVVGTIARNLHKCGERHLAELAEWLRKQQATSAAAAKGPKPELPSGLLDPETPTGTGWKYKFI